MSTTGASSLWWHIRVVLDAMLVLMAVVGNLKKQLQTISKWHEVRTKFHPDPSSCFLVESCSFFSMRLVTK
jgi:hypothetical protein